MNKLNYHAKLIVYGLTEMDKRTLKRLIEWLRAQADEFEMLKEKEYAKRFTTRIMK